MKNATVIYHGQSEDPKTGFLFEGIEDLKLLQKHLTQKAEVVVTKFVRSNETADRFGHIIGGLRGYEKSLSALACSDGVTNEINPIYMLPVAIEKILTTAVKMVATGRKVFVNNNGGMCFIDEEPAENWFWIELTGTSEFTSFEPVLTKVNIVKGAKVINLENDPELERHSIEYMKSRWGDFSHVVELLLFDKARLKWVFEKFVKSGGETVYVYTTGRNQQQMYEYAEAAIECGITDFVFHFNSGISTEIQTFIDWILSKGVSLQLINH